MKDDIAQQISSLLLELSLHADSKVDAMKNVKGWKKTCKLQDA